MRGSRYTILLFRTQHFCFSHNTSVSRTTLLFLTHTLLFLTQHLILSLSSCFLVGICYIWNVRVILWTKCRIEWEMDKTWISSLLFSRNCQPPISSCRSFSFTRSSYIVVDIYIIAMYAWLCCQKIANERVLCKTSWIIIIAKDKITSWKNFTS